MERGPWMVLVMTRVLISRKREGGRRVRMMPCEKDPPLHFWL